MDKGVDNGNIIFQSVFPITDKDTAASLIIKISELAVNNLPALLPNWPDIPEITQDEKIKQVIRFEEILLMVKLPLI